jgi:hypothetical protein
MLYFRTAVQYFRTTALNFRTDCFSSSWKNGGISNEVMTSYFEKWTIGSFDLPFIFSQTWLLSKVERWAEEEENGKMRASSFN